MADAFEFRLRFDFPKGNFIGSDEQRIEILHTSEGQVVRLRSGAKNTPIKDSPTASVLGGPYPSADDARKAAVSVRTGLLIWAVNQRVGIDLGGGPPTGGLTDHGVQHFSKQLGAPVRNDVHGIDVFESTPGVLFMRMDIKAALGKSVDTLIASLQAQLAHPTALSAKQVLAGEMFSSSFFEENPRTRFITMVTAVEALLDPPLRPSVVQEWVDAMASQLAVLPIEQRLRDSLRGQIGWLKQDSIGQTGRALSQHLLEGRTYGGVSAADFFTTGYNIRSQILHTGAASAAVNIPNLASDWQAFVGDLLNVSFQNPG